jgi:hypothetical protein
MHVVVLSFLALSKISTNDLLLTILLHRMLIALSQEHEGFVGIIQKQCSPLFVAQNVVADAEVPLHFSSLSSYD